MRVESDEHIFKFVKSKFGYGLGRYMLHFLWRSSTALKISVYIFMSKSGLIDFSLQLGKNGFDGESGNSFCSQKVMKINWDCGLSESSTY